jgi:hypothetical protein
MMLLKMLIVFYSKNNLVFHFYIIVNCDVTTNISWLTITIYVITLHIEINEIEC